ncbi:MAG: hypothetical protein OXL68_00260 [Paracoccaceae bacterium]|nr:hypothetical protein [Paracoccaceae bacterium]
MTEAASNTAPVPVFSESPIKLNDVNGRIGLIGKRIEATKESVGCIQVEGQYPGAWLPIRICPIIRLGSGDINCVPVCFFSTKPGLVSPEHSDKVCQN